jgi:hypothetical protein
MILVVVFFAVRFNIVAMKAFNVVFTCKLEFTDGGAGNY